MRLAAATGADSVSSAPKESVTDSSWPGIPTRGSGLTSNSEWNMPTLLQVGTIEGTLNDVMYGLASFDAVGTLIKSSYTAEEVVDAETLYELQGPTPEEPFRFLGIKWVVKSTSSSVKAFVWPRDLTFIAATGILNRQGGERVGYHLMHSVDLGKGYGPLEGKRIVRGRISSCYLYRQTSSNTVDVYMKTNFEPNGSVHESVALLSAANSLTRPDINRHRRGTVTASEREQEKLENEKIFHTAPVRRVSRTPRQTHSQRKLDSNAKPAWDYNSETEENDGDNGTVVSSNTVLLPLDSEPRKTRTRDTRARSNSRKTVTKQNLSKNDAEIPIVAHPDVWDVDSDTDYEVDYVVTSQTHPEVPILGDALPEAVVQYAWGAVVPSPTNKESSEAPAPWPSPPSSPLPSPTPLPKEKEDSWPTTQGERASVWTPPVSQPTTSLASMREPRPKKYWHSSRSSAMPLKMCTRPPENTPSHTWTPQCCQRVKIIPDST
ncbi:hypothetical protein GQ600_16681 [Phytophthora cactorum]|nr:hypothetical protein GQ600_16681 [Phytophthora cactorum]